MRTLLAPFLLAVTFAGCLSLDVHTPASTGAPPGIAVGEPHPGTPVRGFRTLADGEWCHYDEASFDGRVLPNATTFQPTWQTFIDCRPEADYARPVIDWQHQFVVALIAPASGCVGAQLRVDAARVEGRTHIVTYEYHANEGEVCGAAMSRPVAIIVLEQLPQDSFDVRFEKA